MLHISILFTHYYSRYVVLKRAVCLLFSEAKGLYFIKYDFFLTISSLTFDGSIHIEFDAMHFGHMEF